MAHRLNTNKQFMIGNGILAFAVIFVVVLFVYLSYNLRRERLAETRYYTEVYSLTLSKGFAGDSLSIFINDSLLLTTRMVDEPLIIEVKRFDEQSALLIVDHSTERVSTFDLSNKGEEVLLVKDERGIHSAL